MTVHQNKITARYCHALIAIMFEANISIINEYKYIYSEYLLNF